MSKSAASKPGRATSPPPIQVSHLDDKITRFVGGAVKSANRYKYPILIACGVVVLGCAAYGLSAWLHYAEEEGLSERLYRLVESSTARDPDTAPLLGELDRLVADARGADVERHVLKSVAQYLAERAFAPPDGLIAAAGSGEPPAGQKADMVRRLDELARQGRERFKDDPDMQAWAANVLERVKAEGEFRIKSQDKRSFAPVAAVPPPLGPPEGTAASSPPAPPEGTAASSPPASPEGTSAAAAGSQPTRAPGTAGD